MTDRENLLKEKLGLKHLNVEEGLFSLVTQSSIDVVNQGEQLSASNLIYLMLNRDEPVNYVQRLESDDYQILIEGGPADYYLFYPDGRVDRVTMGSDIENDEQLVVPAPGGTAKAIVLHENANYLLAASVVTPAWTPTRVEIGGDDKFVERYKGSAPWATEEHLRALIGPNFGTVVGGRSEALDLSIDADGQIIFLGMQLSVDQADKEFERFSTTHPGSTASLTISKSAPAEIVASVVRSAQTHQVPLQQESGI